MKPPLQVNYAVALLEQDRRNRRHIVDELLAIKHRYAIRDRRVLELGCGLGVNLEVFAHDNHVTGIDGLPDAVAHASKRGIEAIAADLEDELPLEAGVYDWILCLDVLEHLVRPSRLLQSAHRVAKRGAKLVVNVPNHFDLKGRLRLLRGSGMDVHRFFPATKEWDNPHVRFFTHGGIRELLHCCGFTLIEDRSAIHSSFAWLNRFAAIRNRAVRMSPSLLAGGFFLIAQRT